MRYLLIGLFSVFSIFIFSQSDSTSRIDSILEIDVNNSIDFVDLKTISDCAHSHTCCESGCECCPLLSLPQEYDTTEIVRFENTSRYTVIERLRYAASYGKSKVHYLFESNNGKEITKYYSTKHNQGKSRHYLEGHREYLVNIEYSEGTDFEDGSEVVFDDDFRFYRISEDGQQLDFTFQITEKITENVHRVSILLNDQRVFGLTTSKGELIGQGVGYGWIRDPNENGHIIATQTNQLTNVFDRNGKLLFNKPFYGLEDIGGGFFKAKTKKGEVLVDAHGHKLGRHFDQLGTCSNGMIRIYKGGKYGFINTEGKLIIRPRFQSTLNFSNDRAAVSTEGEKWGFIDASGQFVIPVQFDDVKSFNGERACVAINNNENIEKWGVIDIKGDYIVELNYDNIYQFKDGYAKVRINEKGRGEGIIDLNGKVIIECQYGINGHGIHYPWFINDVILLKIYDKSSRLLLKNSKGKTVKELNDFTSGKLAQITNKLEWLPYFIVINKGGKKGMIDTDGNILIKANYDTIYLLDDSTALLSNGKKLSIINYINGKTTKITNDQLKIVPSMGLIVTESKEHISHYFNYKGELLSTY